LSNFAKQPEYNGLKLVVKSLIHHLVRLLSFVLEAIILLLLFVANGFFALSEISVVSSRKVLLQQLAEEGNTRAKAALRLAENPTRFLSTVQIGITLVGILAGAYGSANFSGPLATLLARVSWLEPYSRTLSVVLVVLIITYLSLVLGELVPKRIGLNNPERIAMNVAGFMDGLSRFATPFVKLLSGSTELILRLLRIRQSDAPPTSDAEITGLMAQGAEAGVFEETEQDIVENVFWLSDRDIVSVMQPRLDIIWLDTNASPDDIRKTLLEHRHSRFVVADGSLDKVLGIVDVRQLLPQVLSGAPLELSRYLEQPLYFPETTPVLRVLERFKETNVHFALVVDEYGSIEGMVTLSDILESIVEVSDPEDEEEQQIIQREDGSYLLDGLLDIDDFKERFDIDVLPSEDDSDFRTMGGFVITYLGHIPKAGEYFDWQNYRFEVMDMDGNRVDKVMLMQREPSNEVVGEA
jgi:putative hemolysin